VTIRKSARVQRIEHRAGRVTGVVVDDAHLDFERVLCNADVVTAFNELIEGRDRRQKRLNRLEPSLSGMVFLWGVRGTFPGLQHHNIFFSADYRNEFEDIFARRKPPEDPTVYVAITCRTDPGDAPAGSENWFVLVNTPYLVPGVDWSAETSNLRNRILLKLRQQGFDVADRIEFEQVLTPEHFMRAFGSNRGSIYGISSNTRAMAFRRPANRSRDLRGLYFAGGACHPGGGVPLTLLSGKMAADLILESWHG